MKLLLTTDDGIDSPGFAALVRAATELGDFVVVAPRRQCSGVGHACTTHDPIRARPVMDGWFAVDGTPVDCVRLGVRELAPDVDVVVAGVNRGANLGADTYISGTVAAAREAALLEVPAIAISQYVSRELEIDWQAVTQRARRVLADLLARGPRPGRFWNANLPHVPPESVEPEIVFCGLDTGPLGVRFRVETDAGGEHTARYDADYHARPRQPGRDVEVCFEGSVAVTSIPLDITGD